MVKGIKELIRGIEVFVGWVWKALKGLIKVCLLVVGLLFLGYVILTLLAPETLITYRTSPTPLPTIVLKPAIFVGCGDDVVDVGHCVYYTKAHLICEPTSSLSNFIVWPFDENNNRRRLLVNAYAPYDGVVKWDQKADTLEIKAECRWTITLSR